MKIAGLSVVGTLLATLLYYFFEFGWYSILQAPGKPGKASRQKITPINPVRGWR